MKYSFNVKKMKVENHIFYVVESNVLNGCVAQGDTLDEAIALFAELENEWLETAKSLDIPIPDEITHEETSFSGKLMVRLPKSLHKKIAQEAENESTSINQLIVSILSEAIGYKKGSNNAYMHLIQNSSHGYKANNINYSIKHSKRMSNEINYNKNSHFKL